MKNLRIKEPKREYKDEHGFSKVIVSVGIGTVIGGVLFPGIGGKLLGAAIGAIFGLVDEKDDQMSKVPVFYSFHFANDVMRVQQIRNIGVLDGNPPTTPNEWEKLKRTGDKAVENWIDQNMKYKRCIVVLVGSETASRPWVRHEIIKAWNDGKALLGIHIHNLKCPRSGVCKKGSNPFDSILFEDGRKLSQYVPCIDPSSENTYRNIADNISIWINDAINNKAN